MIFVFALLVSAPPRAEIDALWAQVQQLRGLSAKTAVVVEALSDTDFAARLLDFELATLDTSTHAMTAAELSSLEKQLAIDNAKAETFYDTRAKKIFVGPRFPELRADKASLVSRATLVDRLERALQDQYFDSEKFSKGKTQDEISAKRALLGADAELTAWLWIRANGAPPAIPAPTPAVVDWQAWSPFQNFEQTAVTSLLPIYFAAGWDGINELFNHPPVAAIQLLNATGLFREYEPLAFESVLGAVCTRPRLDTLGALALASLSPKASIDLRTRWVGDQLETCERSDGGTVAIWTIAFRHSADARQAALNMYASLRNRMTLRPPSSGRWPVLTPSNENRWPRWGHVDRNLAIVWMTGQGATEGEGERWVAHALGAAPKQTMRAEIRARANRELDSGDFAACGRDFAAAVTLGGDYNDHYNAGCCLARLGDNDGAFHELALVAGSRFRDLPELVKDPDLASLRKDPRWSTLLAVLLESEKRYAKTVDPELLALYEVEMHNATKRVEAVYLAHFQRVRAIVAAGKMRSADDYLHAAWFYLSATQTDDLILAHKLAMRAADIDPSFVEASAIAGTAEDRLLLSQHRAQKFGTQSYFHNGQWELYPVDPDVSDDERLEWDLPSLAAQRKQARERPLPAHK